MSATDTSITNRPADGAGGPESTAGNSQLSLRMDYTGTQAAVLSVAGDLDLATTPELAELLWPRLLTELPAIVLELRGVTFLGVAGLELLTSAHAEASHRDVPLSIVTGTPVVDRALAVAGLEASLPCFASISAALRSHGESPPLAEPPTNDLLSRLPGSGSHDSSTRSVADWRQRRLTVHLAALREPLREVELGTRDHDVLAQLADQDASAVGAIANLLTRARSATSTRPKEDESMVGGRENPRLAETFVALADTMADDFDLTDFLELLSQQAVELLNVTASGVILSDKHDGQHPTVGSSETTQLLGQFSAQSQEGPGWDCLRDGVPVASSDLVTDSARWPRFADAAAQAGFGAAYAVPMRLRGEIIGSLVLLNTDSVGVDDASIQLGQTLADMATIGLLHRRAIRDGETVTEQLQTALHHRVAIEQAKGILAEYGDVALQQAFDLLRGYARSNNQRLPELANSIVEGTTDPGDIIARQKTLARTPQP